MDMIPGKKYRIVHRSETQRRDRVSVMVYLGDEGSTWHLFSARPVAGTQMMPKSWIKDITQADDNAKVSLNEVV